MLREILFSSILHVVIIGSALVISPLKHARKMEFGEVIKVSIMSLPEAAIAEPASEPVPIPEPAVEELPDMPIDDPTTKPKVEIPEKEPEKPKEKPEPEPKKEPTRKAPVQQETEPEPSTETEIEAPGAGAGTPFAGATVDNSAFNYPSWFSRAFRKIQTNFRNPVSSDAAIVAVIRFQVIQSGRVIELSVVQSSGIQTFDDACMIAVSRSAPFPPLPKSFRDEIIGITLPFKYEP
jgi:protein TonB